MHRARLFARRGRCYLLGAMALDDTLRHFEAGRAATVAELRELADHLEQLELAAAAEVLGAIALPLEALRRAARLFETTDAR